MNRWRLFVILLIIGSLLLIFVMSSSDWGERNFFRDVPGRWQSNRERIRSAAESFTTESYPFISRLSVLVTMYLSGILTLYAFPRQIRRMEIAYNNRAGNLVRMATLGFLVIVFLGVLGMTSAMVMSTFPLTILFGVALFLISFLGFVAFAYALGAYLARRAAWKHASPLFMLFLGLLILFALSQAPYIGLVIRILLASLGSGVVIATRFGSGQPWNLMPLLVEE